MFKQIYLPSNWTQSIGLFAIELGWRIARLSSIGSEIDTHKSRCSILVGSTDCVRLTTPSLIYWEITIEVRFVYRTQSVEFTANYSTVTKNHEELFNIVILSIHWRWTSVVNSKNQRCVALSFDGETDHLLAGYSVKLISYMYSRCGTKNVFCTLIWSSKDLRLEYRFPTLTVVICQLQDNIIIKPKCFTYLWHNHRDIS